MVGGILILCHILFGINRDPTMLRHLGMPKTIVYVNWNGYPHETDKLTAVGVPYAPSRIRFGSPHVRESVGPLAGSVLELDPSQTETLPRSNLFYEQIEFSVAQNAKAYRVTCDFTISPRDKEFRRDSLTFFFDGRLTTKLVFDKDQIIRFFDYPFVETDLWEFPVDEIIQLRVLLNFEEGSFVGFVNGRRFEFPLEKIEGDLDKVRVNFSDPSDRYGRAAIDNLKVISFGAKPL